MKAPNNAIGRKGIAALSHKLGRLSGTLGVLLVVGVVLVPRVQHALVDIRLLYRVENEVLSASLQGHRYIDLFYSNSAELTSLLQADPALRHEALSVLDLWQPNLQALVDGKGAETTITAHQVQAVVSFLDHVSAAGSPELRQIISTERARQPLEPLAGLPMDQAYVALMGQALPVLHGYTLTWLPPLNTGIPYYLAVTGSTIPVDFTIQGPDGRPVIDRSAILTILGPDGVAVVGPIGIGNDPAKAIILKDNRYHFDFQTIGLGEASYTLIVSYDSTNPAQPSAFVNLGLIAE